MSDDESAKTYDRALNMLAFRARSERELRRQLARKGEPAEHIDSAIERLLRVGLLDDLAFARQFVRAKTAGPGLSKRRLQTELARKGVARDVADSAIAEVFTDENVDQEAMIERVADKKLRSLAKLDPVVRKRRLYAFLARRGYGPDEIRRVMERG